VWHKWPAVGFQAPSVWRRSISTGAQSTPWTEKGELINDSLCCECISLAENTQIFDFEKCLYFFPVFFSVYGSFMSFGIMN
jgi:hypothetical protein